MRFNQLHRFPHLVAKCDISDGFLWSFEDLSIVEKKTQDMDDKEPVVNMKGHFSPFLHFLGPTRVRESSAVAGGKTLEPLLERWNLCWKQT